MAISDTRGVKRGSLIEALADIALADGIEALSLRPVAARLGTSDRMLLYYFRTKAAMIGDVLACVTDRFDALLADSTRGNRVPPHMMVGYATDLMTTPGARPFVRLWLEIAARAGRGDPVYAAAADRIGEIWVHWIVRSVHFQAGMVPRSAAAMMLAIVNGMLILDATAPSVAAAARTRVQAAAA